MATWLQRAAAAACTLTLGLTGALSTTAPASAATASCSAGTSASARPALAKGASGSCVRDLQKRLSSKGYTVATSGSFDASTDLAVRRFQSSKLGVPITGKVDATTWKLLINGGGTTYSMSHGPNRTSKVVLTFDDCPTSMAAFKKTVLAAEKLGIRMVLFPYAQCAQWGKIDYSYARAHGHYVFNHSLNHARYTALSQAGVARQITAGPSGTFGRPPYGSFNTTTQKAFAANGMRIWTWDVDTNDWTGKSRDSVVNYVVRTAKPGNTVLMHMQYAAFNADALTRIKSGLAKRGLQVCRNTGAVGSAPQTLAC